MKELTHQAGKEGPEKAGTEEVETQKYVLANWKGALYKFLRQRDGYILTDSLLSFQAEIPSFRASGFQITLICSHRLLALPGSFQYLGHWMMELHSVSSPAHSPVQPWAQTSSPWIPNTKLYKMPFFCLCITFLITIQMRCSLSYKASRVEVIEEFRRAALGWECLQASFLLHILGVSLKPGKLFSLHRTFILLSFKQTTPFHFN